MKTVSPFRKLETEKEDAVTKIDGLRASASRCFSTLAEHAGLDGGVYTCGDGLTCLWAHFQAG